MSPTLDNASADRRILVVTDTPEDMETLHAVLAPAGYELSQTWSTPEALEAARAAPPGLILLDIDLTESEGTDFCSQLHSASETEAVPVIAITEENSPAQANRAYSIGADGVLCRPFQSAELLTRIRTLVRMKGLHDRIAEQNRQLVEINARLEQLNKELMGRNRELEQGMAMAHLLQEALLPQQYPPVKNIAFAHKYDPAETIGGDFFQIVGMPDGRAAIFIADVSGHGVRAAIISSIVKTVIDYIDLAGKTPSDVLRDFNSRFRSVLGPMTPQIYATAVFMMVDGERRSIAVACAGHPAPLHINKQDMTAGPILPLEQSGPALGFLPDPDYPTVERNLGVGDIVLGFTDGIYEVLNARHEMFGLSRLERLVAANTRLVPRDLIQRLLTETEAFMGAHKRPDDVCIVAVEVL